MRHKTQNILVLLLVAGLMISLCGCSAIRSKISEISGSNQMDTAIVKEETSAQVPEETTTVEVSDVEEFLNAIDSNVTIYLKEGTYNLSQAADYGTESSGNYRWNEVYDGYEFTIQNVDNLRIVGAGQGKTVITSDPRFAHVIVFENCDQVQVQDLTAGHTEQPGECTGGVLGVVFSSNCLVSQCGLYGCGTFGVTTKGVSNLEIKDSEIYDCTIGALSFSNSQSIAVDGCNIHDCPTPLLEVYDCTDITMDGETVESINF